MRVAFGAPGLPAPVAAAIRAIIGLRLDIASASLLPGPARSRALHLVEDYRTAFFALQATPEHDESLFPGTLEMLDSLVHPEVFLGIANGKNRRGLHRVLERHGLAPRFHNLKTADDGHSKPHTHRLEVAMAEVGVDPAKTVMDGATTHDIEKARAD